MRKKQRPTCYIIAGQNGAGKTTFALRYLLQIAGCRNFVNADLIAYGISPFDSLSAQLEAGRIFLREIHTNIKKRVDFAFPVFEQDGKVQHIVNKNIYELILWQSNEKKANE